MDPIVAVIVLAVLVPLAIVWALAKSASLRGPAPRAESKRPVETLVTEAIPEERPESSENGDGTAAGYQAESDGPPSAPAAG